jgi:hypothetical protein
MCFYAGAAKRTDRHAALAGAVVAGESLIFTATDATERPVLCRRHGPPTHLSKPSLTAVIAHIGDDKTGASRACTIRAECVRRGARRPGYVERHELGGEPPTFAPDRRICAADLISMPLS